MPERFGMRRDTVGRADDENGVILYRQGALGLAGEVDVTGCVDQRKGAVAEVKDRLL